MKETTLTLGIPARMAREVVASLEEWKKKNGADERMAGGHGTPMLDGWSGETH